MRATGGSLAPAAKLVAISHALGHWWRMAGAARRTGRRVFQAMISIVVAALLVGVVTVVRYVLTPYLGVLSPFMLYVGAVLVAGLVRGPGCGALVMLGGGILGFQLFLTGEGASRQGSILSLMLFWGVSAPVLATASELRVQLRDAMARLTAAIDRKGQNRLIS